MLRERSPEETVFRATEPILDPWAEDSREVGATGRDDTGFASAQVEKNLPNQLIDGGSESKRRWTPTALLEANHSAEQLPACKRGSVH